MSGKNMFSVMSVKEDYRKQHSAFIVNVLRKCPFYLEYSCLFDTDNNTIKGLRYLIKSGIDVPAHLTDEIRLHVTDILHDFGFIDLMKKCHKITYEYDELENDELMCSYYTSLMNFIEECDNVFCRFSSEELEARYKVRRF